KEEHKLESIISRRHKNLGARFRFLRKPFDELEIQAKYCEIEEFFINRPYPFPIEYAKQLLSTRTTGWARILAIKDLIESFLKYGIAIMMCDIAQRERVNVVELKIRLLQELTLGAWLQWFESALHAEKPDGAFEHMPEL